jgi:hypothetical protein
LDHNFTVIDADAHHLDEPAYKNYLPERFRARSGPYFPSFGWDIFLNGTAGRKPANPAEYCKDLDVEKIGDAVAYPSNALAIGLVRELDLAVELAKAYNNWAYDFCKSTGNRVKYAAVIAPQVVPEAVKEIRRAVTENVAVGVMMPLPETQSRLSRSRRRLFALLDGALRRKISSSKIGDGAAQDAAQRVPQGPSLLLHLRRRGVGAAAGYRSIRRRVHDVCLRLSALGHGMAAQRKPSRRAQRHLG